VQRLVVVSIIGSDRFAAGYGRAKVVHERLALAGAIPARILRASQFHEFVGQLVAWSSRGDVVTLPEMRTQLVASRCVAEALADLATDPSAVPEREGEPIAEIAGPRAENLAAMARLLLARLGDPRPVEEVDDPSDPNGDAYASGALLPGPRAVRIGPSFPEWLDSNAFAEWRVSQR
jgi:uncharacterized protein YbjT (DUF2867 family)